MAVAHISLLAVLVLIALVVGGIVLLATMLATERGRTILKVFLIVPALVLVVGIVALFGWRFASFERHREAVRMHSQAQEEISRQLARFNPHLLARLSGSVTCNNRLVSEGSIRLVPVGGNEGPTMNAKIVDGRFSFPQVLYGPYRVEISATRGTGAERVQYLPPRYNLESDLRFDVSPGVNGTDFALSVEPDEEPGEGWLKADGEPTEVAMAAAAPPKVAESAAEPKPSEEAQTSEKAETSDEPKPTPEKSAEKSPAEPPAAESAAEEAPATPTEPLPAWVRAGPEKDEATGAYRMPITVGPYSSRLECERELPKELQAAVDRYVAEYLGPRARGEIHLPLEYVQNQIVREKRVEQKRVRITPEGQIPEQHVMMPRLHVLLEFDHAANARIEEEWDKAIVHERLGGVGVLAAMVFALLAMAYAYLKIDLATAGAYRGRLRLAAAALVLLLIVAGAVLTVVGSHYPVVQI